MYPLYQATAIRFIHGPVLSDLLFGGATQFYICGGDATLYVDYVFSSRPEQIRYFVFLFVLSQGVSHQELIVTSASVAFKLIWFEKKRERHILVLQLTTIFIVDSFSVTTLIILWVKKQKKVGKKFPLLKSQSQGWFAIFSNQVTFTAAVHTDKFTLCCATRLKMQLN